MNEYSLVKVQILHYLFHYFLIITYELKNACKGTKSSRNLASSPAIFSIISYYYGCYSLKSLGFAPKLVCT